MKKEIWQKNNPKIKNLLEKYFEVLKKNCNTEDEIKLKNEELFKLRVELNQENMNSQLMWIALRTCKGIPCKRCYLNQVCQTFEVKDSQKLAADVIKNKLGIMDKPDEKTE